jgi:hypothetical protein
MPRAKPAISLDHTASSVGEAKMPKSPSFTCIHQSFLGRTMATREGYCAIAPTVNLYLRQFCLTLLAVLAHHSFQAQERADA